LDWINRRQHPPEADEASKPSTIPISDEERRRRQMILGMLKWKYVEGRIDLSPKMYAGLG
jgi:hypothetical protein